MRGKDQGGTARRAARLLAALVEAIHVNGHDAQTINLELNIDHDTFDALCVWDVCTCDDSDTEADGSV